MSDRAKEPAIPGIGAIRDDVVVRLMLRMEDCSDWLKHLIHTGCERDPLDVIMDLEKGLIVFRSVFDRLIEGHLPQDNSPARPPAAGPSGPRPDPV